MLEKKLIVTEVVEDDKRFHIETKANQPFSLEKRFLNGVVPKVGDEVKLILRYCSQIVGVDINGKKVYRLTPEQEKEILKEQQRECKQRYKEHLEESKKLLDEMFESLPRLLQCRIELFRQYVPDFKIEEDIYELSVVFLSYEIYTNCKVSNIEWFSNKIDKFNVVEYIKSHRILKKLGITAHQVMFAKAIATTIFRDSVEEGVDLFSPTKEQIKKSLVMNLPNALSSVDNLFCWPRKVYLDKFTAGLE